MVSTATYCLDTTLLQERNGRGEALPPKAPDWLEILIRKFAEKFKSNYAPVSLIFIEIITKKLLEGQRNGKCTKTILIVRGLDTLAQD